MYQDVRESNRVGTGETTEMRETKGNNLHEGR